MDPLEGLLFRPFYRPAVQGNSPERREKRDKKGNYEDGWASLGRIARGERRVSKWMRFKECKMNPASTNEEMAGNSCNLARSGLFARLRFPSRSHAEIKGKPSREWQLPKATLLHLRQRRRRDGAKEGNTVETPRCASNPLET